MALVFSRSSSEGDGGIGATDFAEVLGCFSRRLGGAESESAGDGGIGATDFVKVVRCFSRIFSTLIDASSSHTFTTNTQEESIH